MSRRRYRRSHNSFPAIAGQLGAFAVLAAWVAFPELRTSVPWILATLSFITAAICIVVVVGRWVDGRDLSEPLSFGGLSTSQEAKTDGESLPESVPPNSDPGWNLAEGRDSESIGAASASSSAMDFQERLRAIDWFQFEKLVALLFAKKGYAVERRGGAKADDGVDLILEKDGVRTAVQCKHWQAWRVGVKTVRELRGAMAGEGFSQGMLIAMKGFTGDAIQKATEYGIELRDESDVVKLLEDSDARFDPTVVELLNDARKFCPRCESEMVLRTATRGANKGQGFWGCSSYPRCAYTLPVRES
jgi:hypothetical protein